DLVLVPSVVFNTDIRAVCKRAIIHFLDESAQCAFIDPDSGERCANTKKGHAKGHQRSSGQLLKEGLFVDGPFDSSRFILSIEECVLSVMNAVNPQAHSSRRKWQLLVSKHHREHIEVLRDLGGYPKPGTAQDKLKLGFFMKTSVCYGCLFGNPEYRLPCRHVICESCLRDSDQGETHGQQTGLHMLRSCLICGDTKTAGWPYQIRLRPLLSGLRVLSLDGGGVRGIVELVLLEKVESLIGLDLPIGIFFDLMVGTSSGGIISLGIGAQGRSVKDCAAHFRTICSTGFDNKFLTKTWGLGWLARWIRSSIYTSAAMEKALQTAFSTKPPITVFGMRNHCRNAVTTTVGKDCYLIANYNRGGTGIYMNSELSVWDAARCTSAAPMFFEPKRHDGCDCRDGGLKWNNPIQLAVNESREIWGEKSSYDVVLSVGTGEADEAQGRPSSKFIIPDWLSGLFTALLSTMNGEDEWLRYLKSQQRATERSSRLNVVFPGRQEPALDDFGAIGSMEQTARSYYKFYERLHKSQFNPISHAAGVPSPTNSLELVAERLRASMYYFELRSVESAEEVCIFSGLIRCRLGPIDEGYDKLLKMTAGFKVKESFYSTSELSESAPLDVQVVFSHQSPEEPIRIDVSFEKRYSVAISGFPIKMKVV
ncbi:acyl transferase/acyl hydrolase/lysophospholipase, partial [Ilyonectria robusta]|uniref:acyl transferase/acyl hydrolase/lysophospholipase n=1 Tax=Ilyonectria robusta TaxID=1079257 RepID=UPI001E8E8328